MKALMKRLERTRPSLDGIERGTLFVALPSMPLGAWAGRVVNERVDERVFQYGFWAVVGCYTLRMVGFWF